MESNQNQGVMKNFEISHSIGEWCVVQRKNAIIEGKQPVVEQVLVVYGSGKEAIIIQDASVMDISDQIVIWLHFR